MVKQSSSISQDFDKALDNLLEQAGDKRDKRKENLMGTLQVILASNSIRITGSSLASDPDNGVNGVLTYEYKWVPSDTEKAAPRWDTGAMPIYGNTVDDLCAAYIKIFRAVDKTRSLLRESTEQVKTL
jgi:hypothetical protein